MKTVQVLVVGIGPGGASAARVAAEAGLEVLAVDRNRRIGEPVQCAEFIPMPMGAYAKPEGVLRQKIVGMKSILPSGERYESEFPGYMIDRARFDQAIADQAEKAGASIWSHTRLIELDPDARVATLRCDDRAIEVGYEILIAADGPHSPVAGYLRLPPLKVVQTRQYTVPLLRPYADTDIWLSDDFPGGYAWLFPKGNLANLGLGADKRFEDNLKEPLEALHVQLIRDGLVGETILYRTGGAIPVGGLRDFLVVGRCLFVGDAGGLTHPITGGGISAAVVSGERAGQAAAEYLAGDEDAFVDYEEDVRDQFEASIKRAVERRLYLEQHWRTVAANDDGTMRRGWIAFNEYFEPLVS
nr:NAD(P)/FAD-dependent oxidoreductase [Acidihalobacter ferrooxydans]